MGWDGLGNWAGIDDGILGWAGIGMSKIYDGILESHPIMTGMGWYMGWAGNGIAYIFYGLGIGMRGNFLTFKRDFYSLKDDMI